MKKLILILMFCSPLAAIPQFHTPFECGEHETGITFYGVGEGQECCSGTAQGPATITYFTRSEGKTWKAYKNVEIAAGDAQASCCEDSA